MTQQALDGLEVVVGHEEMAGIGVPEGVGGDTFGDSGTGDRRANSALDMSFV
jgi:hypothetical protein